MNWLFNTVFDESSSNGRAGSPGRRWIPAMDLVATGGHYVLRVDLPGLADQDLTIQLEDNVVTISGEREGEHAQHHEGYYRLERALGGFAPLPHAPGRRGRRKAWWPTSIEACWRSEFPSLSERRNGRSRSAWCPPHRQQYDREHRGRRPALQQPRPGRCADLTQLPSPNPFSETQGAADRRQHSPRSAIPPAAGRRTVGPAPDSDPLAHLP